jgi:predicted membrane channel-forming protein YqfA (hemolysin III family)
MDLKKFLPWSFSLSFVLTIFGALMKIIHLPIANTLLLIGLLSMAIFILLSVFEISNSKKIEGTEKFMWISGLIFFGFFTGLLYVLSYRKKII